MWPALHFVEPPRWLPATERVAGVEGAGSQPCPEPLLPLLACPVCERLGTHRTTGLPHETVVTDRRRGRQPFLDIARFE